VYRARAYMEHASEHRESVGGNGGGGDGSGNAGEGGTVGGRDGTGAIGGGGDGAGTCGGGAGMFGKHTQASCPPGLWYTCGSKRLRCERNVHSS
jgi:hypothetical protein